MVKNLLKEITKVVKHIPGLFERNLCLFKTFYLACPQILQLATAKSQLISFERSEILQSLTAGFILKVQQGVAQLPKEIFLNSIINRISWSHHVILSDKVIGIADYQISKAIPDELKSSLPQIEDLEQELKSNQEL